MTPSGRTRTFVADALASMPTRRPVSAIVDTAVATPTRRTSGMLT